MKQDSFDDKLFISKAKDALRLAEKHYDVKTLGFLNPHQVVLLKSELKPNAGFSISFDGGYDGAERVMLVCCPDYVEPQRSNYIAVLKCTGRDIGCLTHRDYLGSLMGLGIVRETVGDILTSPVKTLICVKRESADYIITNLKKIGNYGIHIEEADFSDIQISERPSKEIKGTVSALRLDSIVALAIRLSRTKASELIKSGLVAVNWEQTDNVSKILKEGDRFSVRGYGKMKLLSVNGVTRKKRISVTLEHYT